MVVFKDTKISKVTDQFTASYRFIKFFVCAICIFLFHIFHKTITFATTSLFTTDNENTLNLSKGFHHGSKLNECMVVRDVANI